MAELLVAQAIEPRFGAVWVFSHTLFKLNYSCKREQTQYFSPFEFNDPQKKWRRSIIKLFEEFVFFEATPTTRRRTSECLRELIETYTTIEVANW
jgi:hypothetical protein